MNNLEIDLTKNLGDLQANIVSVTNTYLENYKSPKYTQYLNMIVKYFNEKKKKKYNNKFEYYVDNEGNFVKEAKESDNEKDNQKINCPKYFNVATKLSAVNTSINNFESQLRYLRNTLLDGKTSSSEDFDKVKKQLLDKLKERELLEDINNYNKKQYNIDIEVLEELLETKINQNKIHENINSNKEDYENYKFFLKRYVENNLKIIALQQKMRELNENTKTDFAIETLPENEVKKKKIKKIKKKDKKEKKAEGIKPEFIQEEQLEAPILDLPNFIETKNEVIKEVQNGPKINIETENELEFDLNEFESDETPKEQKIEISELPFESESKQDLLLKLEDNSSGELKISELELPSDINDIVPEFEDESDSEPDYDSDGSYTFNKPSSQEEIEKDKMEDASIFSNLEPSAQLLDQNPNQNPIQNPIQNPNQNPNNEHNGLNENSSNEQNNNGMNPDDILKLEKDLKKKVKDPNVKMIHLKLTDEEKYLLNKEYKNKKPS